VRKLVWIAVVIFFLALSSCSGLVDFFTIPEPTPNTSPAEEEPTDSGLDATGDPWADGTLLWNDEFEGTAVDLTKWVLETGAGGWGNNELQTYTTTNATIGTVLGTSSLVITAKKDAQGNWTSSRLKTAGLYAPTYGKIEARIKLPYGQGIWPAFWMLGSNIGTVSWPRCGETDILEMVGGTAVGKSDAKAYSTLHWNSGTAINHVQTNSLTYTLPTGRFADAFHTFGVEWTPTTIRWWVDGVLRGTNSTTDPTMGTTFQKPFFLLLNLAVGGIWPGNPDATTVAPQTMAVDWVRVYAY